MRIFVLPEPELCNFTEAEDLQLAEFEQKIKNIYNFASNQNKGRYFFISNFKTEKNI